MSPLSWPIVVIGVVWVGVLACVLVSLGVLSGCSRVPCVRASCIGAASGTSTASGTSRTGGALFCCCDANIAGVCVCDALRYEVQDVFGCLFSKYVMLSQSLDKCGHLPIDNIINLTGGVNSRRHDYLVLTGWDCGPLDLPCWHLRLRAR